MSGVDSEEVGSPPPPPSGEKENSEGPSDPEGAFECNICLDTARDAVISLCGHLFCWPCLHTWLETRPTMQSCPVCKSAISKEKVVPLYGRGNAQQKDPRDKIPPRPRGTRSEPENNGSGGNPFAGFGLGLGGGAANANGMSFGIGAFPFGFFANFSFGGDGNQAQRPRPAEGTAQYQEEQFLHKVFLWVAFAFLFWLFIA